MSDVVDLHFAAMSDFFVNEAEEASSSDEAGESDDGERVQSRPVKEKKKRKQTKKVASSDDEDDGENSIKTTQHVLMKKFYLCVCVCTAIEELLYSRSAITQ